MGMLRENLIWYIVIALVITGNLYLAAFLCVVAELVTWYENAKPSAKSKECDATSEKAPVKHDV